MLGNVITHYDDCVIFDKLENQMKKGARGPLGWVRIFLQTKNGLVYDEGSNLVVAQGREFVAQKIFETYGARPDWTGYKISHFAIGSGGSTIDGGGGITLNGPLICDTQLLTPIALGIGSSYLTEPGGTAEAVKPIIDDGGSLELESESYGGGLCVNYTKMKCTCIIPAGEPEYLGTGESVRVDEAGLYFVSGTTPLMFSHICFAPKWKEKESTLTIVWYILC